MRIVIAQLVAPAVLCVGVVSAAPVAKRVTTPQTMPGCAPGQAPVFNFGVAALSLDLGADMGEAISCERSTNDVGDVDQQTSTGVIHYDHDSDTPSFRRGADNWALRTDGLVYWAGEDAQPPPGAIAIPSPGSARLASIAAQNSTAKGSPVLGSGRPVTLPLPAAIAGALLTTGQVASLATLLGIDDSQVRSMSLADVGEYTQTSGRSVAEVTRTIDTQTP